VAGCGTGAVNLAPPEPLSAAGSPLQGKVYGGQNPVSGAVMQLYAATTGGYGAAATPLIGTSITTGPDGTWSITGKYTCLPLNAQVYITATGGDAGSGVNSNLALMAALGTCSSLSSSTYVVVNELTTVGSIWAISPFMSGLSKVSSSASNVTGLTNAFANVNTLTSTITGTVPGTGLPAGTTVPTEEIYTLANILAACVNSAGGTAGDTSACGKLFTAATPNGGSAPTDTVTAAMNIAQHPGVNVPALFSLAPSTPPFVPALTTAPNDFTIAVNFTGGNLGTPSALASDVSGNIWIANSAANTVTELNNAGGVKSGAGFTASLNAPSAIAVDASGGPWITNKGNNTISRLTSTGGPVANSPYSGGGLNSPAGISFDSLGNAWIADSGSASVTEINSTGTTLSNYTGSGITAPIATAVNPH
jgi:hypothetical protein